MGKDTRDIPANVLRMDKKTGERELAEVRRGGGTKKEVGTSVRGKNIKREMHKAMKPI